MQYTIIHEKTSERLAELDSIEAVDAWWKKDGNEDKYFGLGAKECGNHTVILVCDAAD